MKNEGETFNYTYSAGRQKEIEKIRRKYAPKEEDKMERLRKLDKSASTPGTIASVAIGTLGALILGIGMCCTMVWDEKFFVTGIVIGVIGIAVLASAYPIYNRVTENKRKKIAPEIMRLSDELSQK
jgi:hypothetical protein